MKMLERILQGEPPSLVFKKLIEANPSITNFQIGEMLSNEFIELSSEAIQLVWHWKGPNKSQGLSDENLDALILKLLRESNYL
jgi:hypothetical protein